MAVCCDFALEAGLRDGQIVFGANVLAGFELLSDLHNSLRPLGMKTKQTVCASVTFLSL